MRLRLKKHLHTLLSATLLVAIAAPAWAHPVSAHDRSASTHDRAPQIHDHSAATRRGR